MENEVMLVDTTGRQTVSIPTPHGTLEVNIPPPAEGKRFTFETGTGWVKISWPTEPATEKPE